MLGTKLTKRGGINGATLAKTADICRSMPMRRARPSAKSAALVNPQIVLQMNPSMTRTPRKGSVPLWRCTIWMADKGHDGQCDGSGHDAATITENIFLILNNKKIHGIHDTIVKISEHPHVAKCRRCVNTVNPNRKKDMNEASINFSIVESMSNCLCKVHFLITASEVG